MPETERHPKWERERGRGERREKKSSVTNTDTGSV